MNTDTPSTSNPPPQAPRPAPTAPPAPASNGHSVDTSRSASRGWLPRAWVKFWPLAALVLLAIIAIPIWRALSHSTQTASAGTTTGDSEVQPVAVARVTRQDLYNEVPIPAEFRPYVEDELHAKVSGYVRDMKVDFGDQVKAGQLLATLEVPELEDQLHNAIGEEQKAIAENRAAHLNYTRLQSVAKSNPNLVAEQDLDAAEAKDGTTAAAIAAAKAEVERYQTLTNYTRITAPFDGVITRRYVDPGALVQSGTASETQSLPLVRVSDNYHLRLDFPVSVEYVHDVHVGDQVQVRVESLGGETFKGTITRATMRVNEDTRTMMTEIEVPNPKLELVPGMYAEVLLKAEQRVQALSIPIQALPAGSAGSVYVVNSHNEIEKRPVTTGLETPERIEVTSGLKQGELVVTAGHSQLQVGQKVEPKILQSLAQE